MATKPATTAAVSACMLGVSQAFVPHAAPTTVSQPAGILRGAQESSTRASGADSLGSLAASAVAIAGVAAGVSLVTRRSSGARTDRRVAAIACRAKKDAAFAGGLIGGESAFGEYNFDPLGFTRRYPGSLPWFREAELKHGRICMLAWVGLVVPDIMRIPGPDTCYSTESVVSAYFDCLGTQNHPGPLYQVWLFVSIAEMLTTFPKIVEGLTIENAGDYKLGLNFLPVDPRQAQAMKLKELKNGRLAMIAFGGAITQALLSGNGFPWMYADRRQATATGLSSSVAPAPAAKMAGNSRVAMAAEPPTTGGYKMSKAVPFLPVSPALEGYVGGEEEGFDPMGVSLAIDVRWLREAELKHGRVAMLATVGWIATDLGMRVPGQAFQVSTIDAHDAMVKFGNMPQILVWLGYLELFGFLAIVNMMEGKTDRQPGDFGIRALYPSDPQGQYEMQLKELRNGRLAMLAFGGIVTSAVYTQGTWPFFALRDSAGTSSFARGSALCGGLQSAAKKGMAVRALEASRSLPFLPKPQNLAGYVGEEQEFDPLGFSDTFDMRWLREAELKHGRVCMLASLGFYAQQWITFPEFTPTPNALNSIYMAEPGGLATLVFLAGYIESTSYGGKLTMLDMFEDSDRAPGDLNFGKRFLPRDEEKAKDLAMRELNNGRLAMLGFSGMIHHNLVVKGPLFPLFPDDWTGPQGSWGIENQSTFGMLTMQVVGNESAPDSFFVGR